MDVIDLINGIFLYKTRSSGFLLGLIELGALQFYRQGE